MSTISLPRLHAQFLMAFVRLGEGTWNTPARSGLLTWGTFCTGKEESSVKGYSCA